jgi:hypothetical protein
MRVGNDAALCNGPERRALSDFKLRKLSFWGYN